MRSILIIKYYNNKFLYTKINRNMKVFFFESSITIKNEGIQISDLLVDGTHFDRNMKGKDLCTNQNEIFMSA